MDRSHVRAEAVGIGFRLPLTAAIPLSLAADLVESGVPHVICSGDGRDSAE